MMKGLKKGLASYGDEGFSLFLRKAFIKSMGYSDDALNLPIIGITNTYSDFNPCHGSVPKLIEAIKRGVMLAGGLPMEFPVVSIHESFIHPTSMFLRNLMAMDVEEMIRAQPMDAVVLVGGCDKTVPALLMGAASADLPCLLIVTGPMLTGHHEGERLGACTDCRRMWRKFRAGEIDQTKLNAANGQLAPTTGTCMVMGTASTMACLAETMGMMLPGGASIPATHSARLRFAEQSGARAVALASETLRPNQIMTAKAFHNALVVLQALGGSTNAIIHLAAVAGRLGLNVDLDELDRIGRSVPVLVDLKPSGKYFMENFHESGGLRSVLLSLRDQIHLDALTVSGRMLGEGLDHETLATPSGVIRTTASPVYPTGSIAVLRGNLAPGGAVIKQSAASPKLMKHRGKAVVFHSIADLFARIDHPDLEVSESDVLILRNAGPRGAPGMPEAGDIPIPRKLARTGITDMVRLSDARMSGTSFGTIVLHITPEASIGGPLALVRDGDEIALDVEQRRLDLLVETNELDRRRSELAREVIEGLPARGYRKLYAEAVLQADQGCDFDFMLPSAKPAQTAWLDETPSSALEAAISMPRRK